MTNELENQELQELQDTEKDRFEITDLETANWAFRKYAAIQKKEQEINKLAQDEIERIKQWQESETQSLQDSKDYFEFLLTEFYKKQKEIDPKFKLSTPYGKVTSRKGTKKWNIPNQDEVIKELENRGFNNLVRHKKEINLADMKKEFQAVGDKVVDSNGEVVEGAYIIENPRTYSVKPNN